jgi:GTP-binding protein
MRRDDIRNIVIIAHVDHGKTTLVDVLLRQSGQFRDSQLQGECILDSNELERERGITILAKNIALPYQGVKINIIDTPGHADFGGEVERVVRMADGALLLIDAAEGPLPQTRFVLAKALEFGLKPIVVVNKIDRPDARPMAVLEQAFELLMELGGEEHLDDFPHLFASGRDGYATPDPSVRGESMRPLLDVVLREVPGPDVDPDAPLQMLVTTLDWSEYVGRIAIGRIQAGEMQQGQTVLLMQAEGETTRAKISGLHVFHNLGRMQVEKAAAGEVVAVVGLDQVEIGDTLCHAEHPRPLPRLTVDEPTLEMVFGINASPLSGRDGKYLTTRQVKARLMKELERNVALRVRPIEGSDALAVAGRGVLHLAVLIETMRREGYELSVGKPHVITRVRNGVKEEPFEELVIEVPTEKLGPVMELVGERRAGLQQMTARGDYTHATSITVLPSTAR